jgi:hypothetical protein
MYGIGNKDGPPEDQSRKSDGLARYALPALQLPDSPVRTAPPQFHPTALPKMRSYFHHKRVGLSAQLWFRFSDDGNQDSCQNVKNAKAYKWKWITRALTSYFLAALPV